MVAVLWSIQPKRLVGLDATASCARPSRACKLVLDCVQEAHSKHAEHMRLTSGDLNALSDKVLRVSRGSAVQLSEVLAVFKLQAPLGQDS